MNPTANGHAHEIDRCLREWSTALQRPADALWEFTLQNGSALPVRARLIEDWLQLDAELRSATDSTHIWSALEWNGRLDGAAKFALGLSGRLMRLRAEIPLDGEVAVASDLTAALAGFERAASLENGGAGQKQARPHAAALPSQPEASLPLRELLADAGCQSAERPGGSLMVELESGSDFRQALVEAEPDGSWRASVELARWESHVPASRDALAVLLLTASGAVRMARPSAGESVDGIAARLEIRLASHASPALVGRGLAALSVACRLCAREAAILRNKRIAGRYLAVRGFTNV